MIDFLTPNVTFAFKPNVEIMLIIFVLEDCPAQHLKPKLTLK